MCGASHIGVVRREKVKHIKWAEQVQDRLKWKVFFSEGKGSTRVVVKKKKKKKKKRDKKEEEEKEKEEEDKKKNKKNKKERCCFPSDRSHTKQCTVLHSTADYCREEEGSRYNLSGPGNLEWGTGAQIYCKRLCLYC
jgi:predicted RNA-binding protein with RPS1 domain